MEFEKGDRVRCVRRDDYDPVIIGDTGICLEDSNAPIVRWDIPRDGMYGDKSDCWCMTYAELEHA